jgi:homogentisate 1,2-dioxygenase
MPPLIHQEFETDSFVICSFVPRWYDYHPQSIPAPYYHSCNEHRRIRCNDRFFQTSFNY